MKKLATGITYQQYCTALASLEGKQHALSLPESMLTFLGKLRAFVDTVILETRLGVKQIVDALKNRDVFALLKAIKFDLTLLVRGLATVTSLIPQGLLKAMALLADSKIMQQIKSGALKIDVFLNQHPVLKKLTGVVLAGFLFWMWMNMSFTGSFGNDFDMMCIVDALRGKFTLEDLFFSPSGLASLALLATGFMGLGVGWLGNSAYNVFLAIVYTGGKLAHKSGIVSKMKLVLETKRYNP